MHFRWSRGKVVKLAKCCHNRKITVILNRVLLKEMLWTRKNKDIFLRKHQVIEGRNRKMLDDS